MTQGRGEKIINCKIEHDFGILYCTHALLPLDVSVLQQSVLPLDVSILQQSVLPLDAYIFYSRLPFPWTYCICSPAVCPSPEKMTVLLGGKVKD